MFGTQFAIFFKEGKFFIRDFSSASDNLSMLIKLPKDQKFKISEGSLLSFAASTDYELETFSNNHLKMNFFRHSKKPTNVYDPPAQVVLDIPEQGLRLGRVSKDNQIVIGNKYLSGSHCVIFGDGVVDTSGNGTFVYVKSHQEVVRHHQSQAVEIQKSTQL